jgi:secreted trypsin-like serine protease
MAPMRRFLLTGVALLLLAPALAGGVTTNNDRGVKILGGGIAAPGQFPWMAAIMDSKATKAIDGTFCGGTVIAPRVVLTAAHCMEGTRPSEVNVVVGRTRLTQESDGQRIAVDRIVVDPDYNAKTTLNDVALIRLAQPTTVQPMPLAHPADDGLTQAGAHVLIMGWGATREGGNISDELRFVRLTVRLHNPCDRLYGNLHDNSQLCIGSSRAGEDSCQGDSGGPVIAGDGDAARLVGTVSFGEGCGRKGVPGVYTRVSHFAQFIDAQTAQLNGDAVPPKPPVNAPDVRIGKIDCATVYCDVTLRTTGRAPAGGIALNVVRRRTPGHKPVDTLVFAKQLSATRWIAHVNLPYGNLTLYAIPLTAAQDDLDGNGDVQRIQVYSG